MKESNHWLQLWRVERCDAGLELALQVVLHDAHVSYPDWEHVLIQGVYQRKEFIQVLVLEKGEGTIGLQSKLKQVQVDILNNGERHRWEKEGNITALKVNKDEE